MSREIACRILLAGFLISILIPQAKSAESSPALNADEQKAINLIKDWVAAWHTKDADKVLSFMDENCQYRDDPFQVDLKKGRELLRSDINMLLRGLSSMRIESMYAVGSPLDAVVIVRRTDTFNLQGKEVSTPMAAYFRVKNGKILEWLDTPLKTLPPAPKAAGSPVASK